MAHAGASPGDAGSDAGDADRPMAGSGPSASRLACLGCGAIAPPVLAFATRCPAAREGDDIDHVLRRELDPAQVAPADDDVQPFVRYRTRLHAYHAARAAGWSDGRFVDLVRELDAAVARVDGLGFRTTPLLEGGSLAAALGFGPRGGLWLKDETGNVAGSHKARHLFGILLALRVSEAEGQADPDAPLAIASCGNAALAAAVVARAAGRRLLVFVPPSAEAPVVARLRELGAELEVCEREPGRTGDPTYHRLLAAIADGAVPFTVHGTLDATAVEGGATLGWELLDQLADEGVGRLDRLVIHVGGGAFASAQALAMEDAQRLGLVREMPRLDAVQTAGGYPLVRAHRLLLEHLGARDGALVGRARVVRGVHEAASRRSAFMWPWESEPVSIAHGILDDETYDWLAVVRAMLLTGGRGVIVDEATLREANDLAAQHLGSAADHTGTAGLAGLLALTRQRLVGPDEQVAVILSGVRRRVHAPHPPAGGNDRP